MLSRLLIGLLSAGAVAIGVPGVAAADPPDPGLPAPPPTPNVNAYAPVKPSEFAVQNGETYAFAVPGDIVCVISRGSGNYGCNGPLPAAPGGANIVSGAQFGVPAFGAADRPVYVFDTLPNRLLPGSRISYRNVTCGTDGTTTTCVNSYDGGGFVLSPAGSFIAGTVNPLVDRPEGTNPYAN